MIEVSNTVYLFQCKGEDLFAISHDITGANIPRSPCTQGWIFCEQFELGPRAREFAIVPYAVARPEYSADLTRRSYRSIPIRPPQGDDFRSHTNWVIGITIAASCSFVGLRTSGQAGSVRRQKWSRTDSRLTS